MSAGDLDHKQVGECVFPKVSFKHTLKHSPPSYYSRLALPTKAACIAQALPGVSGESGRNVLRDPPSIPLDSIMKALSAVKSGRIYEVLCRQFLQSHLSMQLTMSGGAGDQGVDIRGSWKLHDLHDVIVQCKCYGKPVGPAVVREMEGTAAYYESGGLHSVLSVICAKTGFSEASWKRALSSRFPLLLLHLESEGESRYAKVADQAERADQAMCKGVWINTAFKQSTNDVLKVIQQYLVASGGIKRAIRINFRTVGDE